MDSATALSYHEENMDSSGLEAQWRDIFERHAAGLLTDLSAHFHSALGAAVTHGDRSSRTEARRETAESLNQTFRRLRQTSSSQDALTLLADSTAPYCRYAAVFTVKEDWADCAATRGFGSSEFHIGLRIAMSDAAAFRSAVESMDPVVAAASPNEVSSALFDALGEPPVEGANASVYLFPLLVRQTVLGLLFASGEVQPAPLELLSEATALRWEALTVVPPSNEHPPELIQLETVPVAVPAAADRKRTAWDRLSPEDQAVHLRAQRFARVKVAELRLYRADAVRDGRQRGELYRALRPEMDAARAEFHRNFIGATPTMVDYFHLELLRSVAHEDDRLLGPDYPGPLT